MASTGSTPVTELGLASLPTAGETMNRELSDNELQLLSIAGASEDFIAFVDIYPSSTPGEQVIGWFDRGELTEETAPDGQYHSGGAFFDALWSGNTEMAYRMADNTNKKHMETLFGFPVRNRLEAL